MLVTNEVASVEGDNKSIEKYGNHPKLENCLYPQNRLSKEKNCQKVGIYLISTLRRMGQAF